MGTKVLFINKSGLPSIIPAVLTSAGYEVTEAHEPATALQQLDTQAYNIVILRENATEASWILCERIRQFTASPLIVIGPGASAESCVKAINAGADFFLRKPFGPMELIARIKILLQRAPLRQTAPLVS